MRFLSYKSLLASLVVVFVFAGGYVGYLAALVDIDEQVFFERVQAVTDKERLERQLARAKSILDARTRAYLRRSDEFIRRQRAEALLPEETPPAVVQLEQVDEVDERLDTIRRQITLTGEEQVILMALEEERGDLQFFSDEVDTLEQLLAREFPDDEVELLFAGDRKRRRISDALVRLLQLLDKQRELAQERQEAKETYSYWQRFPQPTPDGVDISVVNKGAGVKELNSVHVTQIATGLSIMPQDFDGRLQRLYIVYGDPAMRRGMSGVGVVFMKGEELDFFRVLVHEFGHIYDLHREVSQGNKSQFYDGSYRLFEDDPSVTYYQYSWASNSLRVADLTSFASSYGTSDPFEDFAEAFALYVLQGQTFQDWAQDDSVMSLKYSYLNDVFFGRTFSSTQQFATRPYDVTMLTVNYDELLAVDI